MKNSEELRQQLRSINRKSYPAYKGLKGLYHFGNYIRAAGRGREDLPVRRCGDTGAAALPGAGAAGHAQAL